MKPILILGLGNPLQGDAGIGCAVAEELLRRPLPDDVECMDGGTPGIGLVNLIQGRRRVILVDAAKMGRAPGEMLRLTTREIENDQAQQSVSLHSAGVSDALALARALHIELPEIVCLGIEPLIVDWQPNLSAPVRAAVPQAVEAVLNEVGANHGK